MRANRAQQIRQLWPVGMTMTARQILAALDALHPGMYRSHQVQNSLRSFEKTGEVRKVSDGKVAKYIRAFDPVKKTHEFDESIMPHWLAPRALQPKQYNAKVVMYQ